MANRTISQDDLESLFPKWKNGSRNHIISDCPFCGKENHFYINRTTQLFDCKKCGVDGNIFKLLHHLGKLFLIGDFKSIDRTKIKLLSDLAEENNEEIELTTPIRKLPFGFKRIYTNSYLESRKFHKRNFENNIIGITKLKPSLENYIVFSINEHDGCKGYVSRYSLPIKKGDKSILRYRNDKGANFSKLLYGFEKLNKGTNTVILVEGLIDAITLDNFLRTDLSNDLKVLATFGKKISQTQILKLLEKGIEKVILIFDYDAIGEMKKFSLELEKYFEVEVGFTFSKDINDSTEIEIGNIFDNLKSARKFNRQTVKKL